MMPEPQCNTVHDVPTRFVHGEKWRRMRGFNHLAKVIKGVQFKDGELINDFQIAARISPGALLLTITPKSITIYINNTNNQ